MHENYPFQKEWRRHRRKTALSVALSVALVAGFYLVAKFFDFWTAYASRELILALFALAGLLLLVFILRTHFWRCPRCRYRPVFPISGRYYERLCVKCGLNKYEGSTYFDGKIKLRRQGDL